MVQYQFTLSYSLIKKHRYTFVPTRNKLRSVYDSPSGRVQNRTALLGVANVKSITFFWNLLVSIFHSFSTLVLPYTIHCPMPSGGRGVPSSLPLTLHCLMPSGGSPTSRPWLLKHFIVWCQVHVEGSGEGGCGWRFAAHVTVRSKLIIKIVNVWHLSIDWGKIFVQPHTCIIYVFWLYSF